MTSTNIVSKTAVMLPVTPHDYFVACIITNLQLMILLFFRHLIQVFIYPELTLVYRRQKMNKNWREKVSILVLDIECHKLNFNFRVWELYNNQMKSRVTTYIIWYKIRTILAGKMSAPSILQGQTITTGIRRKGQRQLDKKNLFSLLSPKMERKK